MYKINNKFGSTCSIYASVIAFVILFIMTGYTSAAPVPDTGITKCYDDTKEIPCPKEGEDFYGQDGNYSINPMSYTKLDSKGKDLPITATTWSMVRDNVTGLIWENNSHQSTWDNAPNIIAELNNTRFGGYSDWRLPTMTELHSIVDFSVPSSGPTINANYFKNTFASFYLSSSANADDIDHAWGVDFVGGSTSHGPNKDGNHYVRAVSGGHAGLDQPHGVILIDKTDKPAEAPVYMGDVVTGGSQMELSINFPAYNQPVDIWVAIQLPDGRIYVVDESGKLQCSDSFVPVTAGISNKGINMQVLTPFQAGSSGTPFDPWPKNGAWTVCWLIASESNGDLSNAIDNGNYELGWYNFQVNVPSEHQVNGINTGWSYPLRNLCDDKMNCKTPIENITFGFMSYNDKDYPYHYAQDMTRNHAIEQAYKENDSVFAMADGKIIRIRMSTSYGGSGYNTMLVEYNYQAADGSTKPVYVMYGHIKNIKDAPLYSQKEVNVDIPIEKYEKIAQLNDPGEDWNHVVHLHFAVMPDSYPEYWFNGYNTSQKKNGRVRPFNCWKNTNTDVWGKDWVDEDKNGNGYQNPANEDEVFFDTYIPLALELPIWLIRIKENPIIPNVGLAGLAIGDSVEKISSQLGSPNEIVPVFVSDGEFLYDSYRYQFEEIFLGIYTDIRNNDLIGSFRLYDKNFRLPP